MVPQHLVILLVKLAVAASLASILTRSGRFQRMLMREERTLAQRVQMALVCAVIFGTGVLARESPFEGINLKHPPLLRCRFLGHLGADGAIGVLKEERRSWAIHLKRYREIEKTYFA